VSGTLQRLMPTLIMSALKRTWLFRAGSAEYVRIAEVIALKALERKLGVSVPRRRSGLMPHYVHGKAQAPIDSDLPEMRPSSDRNHADGRLRVLL
jgi:hypothetical protein